MKSFKSWPVLLIVIIVFLPGGVFAIAETPGWHELPNTDLESVCACGNGFDYACGNTWGGIFAWSSGDFDATRNRLLMWGGGHGDYYGNELYALDLNDQS